MSGVATQQPLERRHSDNPILRIEELRRFPLRPARIPPTGTTFVFRSRSGRLTCPVGGYTAGELLWRGPLVLFQIDLAPHPFTVSWDLVPDWPGGSLVAEVCGRWIVRDPVTVVAQRVSNAPSTCRAALRRAAGDLPPGTAEPDRLARVLSGRLPPVLDVDGLKLQDLLLAVRIEPATDATGVVRALLSTDELDEAGAADLAEAWRVDQELVRSALATLDGDEADSVVREALHRLAELNERLSNFLPGEEGRR